MPLLPGKKNIGHNISEMEKAGHPKSQAIAASLNKARESGVKIPKKKHSESHKSKSDRGYSGRG
jgi:hypothetical protein